MDGASERGTGRRGGTRATIILGTASILSGVGAALGGIAMIAIDGDSFPDYSPYSATGVVAGAGIGWVLGALGGAELSEGGRAVGRSVAMLLLLAAGAAIATAAALWPFWGTFLVTSVLIEGELIAIRIATALAALAVAVTLVLTSRVRIRADGRPPPGMVARVICTAAIVTLSALCSTILVTTYDSQRERLETRMGHATDAAVRLLSNASAFRAENGRFPETHKELMHGARARQAPEVEVLRFDGTTDRFCVVAALLGRLRGTHADDLIVTGLVRTAAGATPLIAEGELPCDDVVADAAPVAGSP